MKKSLSYDRLVKLFYKLSKWGSTMKTLNAVMILIFSAMGSFSAIAAENGRTVIGNVEMPEVQSSVAFEQIKKNRFHFVSLGLLLVNFW